MNATRQQLPALFCFREVALRFPPRGELFSPLAARRRFTEPPGAPQGEAELAVGIRIGRIELGGRREPLDGRRALPLTEQIDAGVEGEEGRLAIALQFVESRCFSQRGARAGGRGCV